VSSNDRNRTKATMRDVAREAGVAQSTVSHYINKTATVAPGTKGKIREAIRKMDYRPNMVARNLKTRGSNILPLFVPDITNPFYSELAKGVADAARKEGFDIVLYDTGYQRNREDDYLELALRQQAGGVVIGYNLLNDRLWERLEKTHTPSILIDVYPPNNSWSSVVVDNEEGIRLAVDYLYSLGHRDIAYLSEPPYLLPLIKRLREFIRILKVRGLEVRREWILVEKEQMNRVKIGSSLGKKLLASPLRPTAVVTSSDLVAIGALNAFLSSGIMVPSDLSLVGFDDIILASYVYPSLTTIRQPKFDMGQRGVKILMKLMSQVEEHSPMVEIIPPQLIERQSCCARR